MKGIWVVLAIALMSLAFAAPASPTIVGARVTEKGVIVAWGYLTVNGTRAPLLLRVEPSSREVDVFYLISNESISILDSIEVNGQLVAAGYVMKKEGSEALVCWLERDYLWCYSLQEGPLFVKSLSSWSGKYALAGPLQGPIDLDIAVVVLNDEGRALNALSIGSPMYNDYVERVYWNESSIVIIGSTWSHNVSLSDALIIMITDNSTDFISVGSSARDDGAAGVMLQSGGIAVVGSTVYYPSSFSEAFYSVVSSGSAITSVVEWSGYIGFVDACPSDGGVIVLGYSIIEGRSRGVITRLDDGNIVTGVIVESESDVVPLAIGVSAGLPVAAFKLDNLLTIVIFDDDLRPLAAFTLGSYASALRVSRVSLRGSYRLTEGWRVQHLGYMIKQLSVEVRQLQIEARSLSLPINDVKIITDEYRERVSLIRVFMRAIEGNIPLLVLFLPLLAIVVAVLSFRRRA